MSTIPASGTSIKITLDTAEAEAQLAKLKGQVSGARGSGGRTGGTPASGGQGGKTPPTLAQRMQGAVGQKLLATLIAGGAGAGLGGLPGAVAAISGQQMGGINPFAASAMAKAPVVATVARGALLYGAARLGGEVASFGGSMVSGALDGLKDIPVLKKLTEKVDWFVKKLDSLEAKVASLGMATAATKGIVDAGAQITGRLVDIPYYWAQERGIAEQQERLDGAFSRWKRNGLGSAIGKGISDAAGRK